MMMMVVDAAMNVKVDVTKSRDVGRDDGPEGQRSSSNPIIGVVVVPYLYDTGTVDGSAAAWLGSALGSRGRREANSRADLDSTSLLLESTLRSLTGAVKYGRMTGPRTLPPPNIHAALSVEPALGERGGTTVCFAMGAKDAPGVIRKS
ncbi:unnamed protein product [Lampetra planeri]